MVKTHKKYQDYLYNPVINTFHLDPTNTGEVQSYIKTLKIIKVQVLQAYQANCLNNSKNLLVNL